MKAILDFSCRRMEFRQLHPESIKIKKSSHQEAEMQKMYGKLKELVPNCAEKNKMSHTELLQNVIDYIFELQDTLDLDSSSSKEPLTENFQSNKMDVEVNKVTILCKT